MRTYGEAWYEIKQNNSSMDIKFDDIKTMSDLKHKDRMSRREAVRYYREKIREYFKLETFGLKDFNSVDDYFGYYEALKFKKELGIV